MKTELAAIRAKKIGVMLKQMRESHGYTDENCANWLGISLASYRAIENGDDCASLPQIESLAYYLDFPFEFFTTLSPASGQDQKSLPQQVNQELMKVRNKTIAILLRQKRDQKGLSLEDLAGRVDIPVDALRAYDEENTAIPYCDLIAILEVLQIPLDQLFSPEGPFKHDSSAPISSGVSAPANLSGEIMDFVSKPANLPYLELAMRFSKMDADKIRTIASSLLEITY
jgi:transcriptional regulator with XRE-family HTH domain